MRKKLGAVSYRDSNCYYFRYSPTLTLTTLSEPVRADQNHPASLLHLTAHCTKSRTPASCNTREFERLSEAITLIVFHDLHNSMRNGGVGWVVVILHFTDNVRRCRDKKSAQCGSPSLCLALCSSLIPQNWDYASSSWGTFPFSRGTMAYYPAQEDWWKKGEQNCLHPSLYSLFFTAAEMYKVNVACFSQNASWFCQTQLKFKVIPNAFTALLCRIMDFRYTETNCWKKKHWLYTRVIGA